MQEVRVKIKEFFCDYVNASKKQDDVPVHSLKAFRRKRGTAPLIIDIGTTWRWVVRFMPWLSFCQKRISVPIARGARCAAEMVWALWGIEQFLAPASSLVATLTVLWLSRSKGLNRIGYCTSIVNISCLNIVLVFFLNGGTLWKLAAILTFPRFLLSPSSSEVSTWWPVLMFMVHVYYLCVRH